ncbi:MAG: alcohol dehydrogenase catalytic domain-containing protein [Rhizobiaceae bacterium]|nr:alcohol dehydrogenase catalytic domain-containing protein [Rhizobiaceae bacterium]
MKALVYTGTMQTEFRDEASPVAGDGEVIVDLSHCGICGSDMHAWHGHDARRIPPLILGHEAVGVARSGKFANKRVALNPLMTDPTCEFSLAGKEHLSPTRELIGMRVPGAFAQAVAIREQNLFAIPDHLSFDEAALAEPLAVCVHAAKLGIARTGTEKVSAIVLGGGAIGLLTALVLNQYGIKNVQIAETNELRRKMLADVTAAKPYNPIDTTPSAQVDLVLDCVGSGMTRKASCEIVKPGGTIIHVGLQDSGEGIDTRHITLQEIGFIGAYCYTNADFQEALDLLASGHISRQGWSEIRPLSEGGSGFEDIHNGKAVPKIILEI